MAAPTSTRLKAATCSGTSRWLRAQQDTQARTGGPPLKHWGVCWRQVGVKTLTMPILGLRHAHTLSQVCWHQHKTRHNHHSDPSSWPECLKSNQSTPRYVAKKQHPTKELLEGAHTGRSKQTACGRQIEHAGRLRPGAKQSVSPPGTTHTHNTPKDKLCSAHAHNTHV